MDNVLSKELLAKLKDMGFAVKMRKGEYTITCAKAEEGLIVSKEGVDNFAYIDGERTWGEASTEAIAKATELIFNELNPKKNERDQKENIESNAEITRAENSSNTALITEKDFEQQTTARSTLLMMQRTDPEHIKTKMVKKAIGGKPAKYVSFVDVQYMTRALNFAFGFNWSFDVIETRQEGEYLTVLGKLIVNMDGTTISKTQWGSQQLRAKMELGDGLKAATSDALKKCASMFGIAADVYAGEV